MLSADGKIVSGGRLEEIDGGADDDCEWKWWRHKFLIYLFREVDTPHV